MWFWLRFFKRWLMHAQTEGLFWWRIYPVKFFFQRFNTGEVQKGYGWTSQGVFCVFAVPPPLTRKKIYLSIVFNFSWDNCNTQEKWKTKLLQNLFCGGGRGVTKVYYGRCANGEWVINVAQSLRSDLKQQYPSSWHSPFKQTISSFCLPPENQLCNNDDDTVITFTTSGVASGGSEGGYARAGSPCRKGYTVLKPGPQRCKSDYQRLLKPGEGRISYKVFSRLCVCIQTAIP